MNNNVYNPIPLIDRLQLEQEYAGYTTPMDTVKPGVVPYQSSNTSLHNNPLNLNISLPGQEPIGDLKAYENQLAIEL